VRPYQLGSGVVRSSGTFDEGRRSARRVSAREAAELRGHPRPIRLNDTEGGTMNRAEREGAAECAE
jgi:hypothetical protein